MILQPFQPSYGLGQAPTLPDATNRTITLSGDHKQVCITNTGTQIIYVRVSGTADATPASNKDHPCVPNSQVIIGTGLNTKLSYISAIGVTYFHVIEGEGF